MLKKYFQGYESEEDEDYNPTKHEEALYRQQHQKKKKFQFKKSTTHQLWLQVREQYKNSLKKVKTQEEPKPDFLQLANKILNSDSIKPDKRIIFAGKQFIMNQDTGQLQIAQKIKPSFQSVQISQTFESQNHYNQHVQRRKAQISYQYLNHVMRAIYNRSRKINSVGKSKLDWKGFVKQEGIQDKLNYHRKGGVIQDMHFIKNAN